MPSRSSRSSRSSPSPRRRAGVLALGLFVALIVAANAVVLGGGRDEDDGAKANANARADIALVLGAGLQPDGRPSLVLQDRLDEALALYREGRVRRILVSGDNGTPSYDEPGAMRDYLEAQGVPAGDIALDHAGFDTYSSMWRAKHVFGVDRAIVVTQRFHLPRALWVGRELGMEVEGRAADRRVYRGTVWHEAREVGSRTKAILDVVTNRTPRYPS